jgi:hypothetical protein
MALPTNSGPQAARHLDRIPLDLPAAFAAAGRPPQAARVVNLSGKGAFVATPAPAPAGARVELTLPLPLSSGVERLRAQAEVRWVNGLSRAPSLKMPPGMGLEFVDLAGPAHYLLGVFIGEHWAARRTDATKGRRSEGGPHARRYVLLDFPASLERGDGTPARARLINLSARGAFLATDAPEPVGRELPLTLTLPYRGTARPIRVTGSVRWINDAAAPIAPGLPPGMGLQFTQCTLRSRQILDEVLDDLLTQIAGHHGL